MAVLIKGMEMPKNCGGCFLRVGQCSRRIYMENRPSACPLIEVPEPHGRLISEDDIDAAVNAIKNALLELKTARTVIPASGEEIDEAQRDYEAAADYQQYCEVYEPTYGPETGAM